ncbi:hypothetical protein [Hymenobacter sp. 5414T-23]|uniref:hypothetical protein n=1 Tax=Hymenobacter sp. 5414T-23 TaxID=2932252 RepID=UPI001FD4F76F|nr:hypothetical protein [Hymenobacter sp. 5414T-23]UOQ79862.1 hypothetical protein MUN83_13525 [Hymenobacter sp. 5414T-23]
MRTPDMSDEELDRLFQRGAEAFPDETSLSGWLRLETQLDEAARQHQVRRQLWQRVAGLFATEMGVVAVFLWLWLGHFPGGLATTGLPTSPLSQTTSTLSKEVTVTQQSTLIKQAATSQVEREHQPLAQRQNPSTTAPKLADLKGSEVALQETRSGRLLRFSRPKMPFAGAASLAVSSSRTYRPAVIPPTKEAAVDRASETALTPAAGSGLATPSLATPTIDEQAIPAPSGRVAVVPQLPAAADSSKITAPAVAAEPTVAPAAAADSLLPRRQRPAAPAYRFLVGVVGGPELSAVLPSPSPARAAQ